jgi:hypothetical protein
MGQWNAFEALECTCPRRPKSLRPTLPTFAIQCCYGSGCKGGLQLSWLWRSMLWGFLEAWWVLSKSYFPLFFPCFRMICEYMWLSCILEAFGITPDKVRTSWYCSWSTCFYITSSHRRPNWGPSGCLS